MDMNSLTKSKHTNTVLIWFILFLFSPFFLYAQTTNQDTTSGVTPEVKQIDTDKIAEDQRKMIEELRSTLGEKLKSIKTRYVNIKTDPEYPEPNQNIEVSLVSSYFDLNRAKIFWYVNGSIYKSGMGVKKINIKTGDTGEGTTIEVIADVMKDGKPAGRITKYKEIIPIEMTLLWEADTYTPPFYKGKALLSPTSQLKIVAIPNAKLKNGKTINPNNLIYIWKGEGRNKSFNENSGYGKNIIYTEGTLPYRDKVVRVEVSSLNDSIKSGKKINIETSNPNILIYEENPLTGVQYNKAIQNNFYLTKQELPLKIEPYFFSKKDKDVGNLKYEWKINGKKLDNQKQKATFRQEKNGSGYSRIKVSVKNIYRKFQEAKNSFVLNFN